MTRISFRSTLHFSDMFYREHDGIWQCVYRPNGEADASNEQTAAIDLMARIKGTF